MSCVVIVIWNNQEIGVLQPTDRKGFPNFRLLLFIDITKLRRCFLGSHRFLESICALHPGDPTLDNQLARAANDA